MEISEKILLTAHLGTGVTWVGSVYMGAFMDWPSAKESVEKGKFPFKFVIGQGKRIFFSVYLAITVLWCTGIALFIVHPPSNGLESRLLMFKAICLIIMTTFTLYGTLFTWPRIQLATHKEAFTLHKFYNYRAYGTFVSGVLASLLTLWFYIYDL